MRILNLSPPFVLTVALGCPALLAGTIFQSDFQGSTVTTGFYTCYVSAPDPSTPCQGNGSFALDLPFVPDWTVTAGSVDLIGDYWEPSVAGTHSIDMDGFNSRGTIQTSSALNTVAGQTYWVTFMLAGNPDTPSYVDPSDPTGWMTKHLQASVGSQFFDFSFNVTGKTRQNMSWEKMQFAFVATGGGKDYLTFQSMTPDAPSDVAYSWGAVVADVKVSDPPIPEPGTLSLALGGLVLVALRLAKK